MSNFTTSVLELTIVESLSLTVWEYSAHSFSNAPAASSEVIGRFASLRSNQAKTASESAHRTFPHGFSHTFLPAISKILPNSEIDYTPAAGVKLMAIPCGLFVQKLVLPHGFLS